MTDPRADILIVGGGLAGCAMAYFLAKEGADVLLIEEHDLGTLASGANAGSLHATIPISEFVSEGDQWAERFAPVIPLLLGSIAMWREVETELGADFEIATPGGLYVAETEAQLAHLRRKARLEMRHGLKVEILNRGELRALAPYLSETMIGAAYCPAEGKGNPLTATVAFASAAEKLGARIMRRAKLSGLSAEAPGFVARTSRGDMAARRVVNCAGASAATVARMVGLDFAIEGFPIQLTVTEPVEPVVKHLVYSAGERLTLKQTRLGAFIIGGGWPALIDAKTGRAMVDPQSMAGNLAVAAKTVPALAGVQVLRSWAGIVNGTHDWRPILGETAKVPGFFTCLFPWTGFTAGPLAARLVADAVLGRKPPPAFAQFFL